MDPNQQSTVWLLPDDLRPIKVISSKSTSKKIIVAFSVNLVIAIIPLDDYKTINAS